MRITKLSTLAAFIWLCSASCLFAGSFFSDFNSGLPAGTAIFGNTTVSTNDGTGGGYTNSGCLKLTIASGGQNGGFVITNDLDSGAAVVSFVAQFKALVGGEMARMDLASTSRPMFRWAPLRRRAPARG